MGEVTQIAEARPNENKYVLCIIYIYIYIYILLHPCILGNRGGLKVINPSHKPLFMYFLINIYKITCIQYTCITVFIIVVLKEVCRSTHNHWCSVVERSLVIRSSGCFSLLAYY